MTISEQHTSSGHAPSADPTPERMRAQFGSRDLSGRGFRDTMGFYASGITIVSSEHAGAPVGMTCQSFYSVSLEPPLVSISVATTSTTYPKIRESGTFCVNVLAADQSGVSSQFARSGTDKWAGIEYSTSDGGNPVIHGTLMWVDCTIEAEYEAGDHLIVVGRVHSMSPGGWSAGDPLLYYKGGYRTLGAH